MYAFVLKGEIVTFSILQFSVIFEFSNVTGCIRASPLNRDYSDREYRCLFVSLILYWNKLFSEN